MSRERSEAKPRVYLSPPHMSGRERAYVAEAFDSNWVAPLGPNVDGFERELCQITGAGHAAALTTGTAAIHLGLKLLGVGPGDVVPVSTLTFSASVNPILYCGATPLLIDSEETSWNLDPNLLERALQRLADSGTPAKVAIVVHLYGQTADMDAIIDVCARHDCAILEDAAEALGSTHGDRHAGTIGRVGVYSFNGNKILTTSGGGALVSDDADLVAHARKLATQAREPAPHYEHTEVGHNYRMSNLLAGVGRGQLEVLADRVAARRAHFDAYRQALGDLPGVTFMPEAPWGKSNRWLTTLTIDPARFGVDREAVRLALEEQNIEARPVWKPMHRQPIFARYECVGGAVADRLFEQGLCLPSGSSLSEHDRGRVIDIVRQQHRSA